MPRRPSHYEDATLFEGRRRRGFGAVRGRRRGGVNVRRRVTSANRSEAVSMPQVGGGMVGRTGMRMESGRHVRNDKKRKEESLSELELPNRHKSVEFFLSPTERATISVPKVHCSTKINRKSGSDETEAC
ncbi:hypothetical protein CDAR_294831 [Caerostris darwini]|uniref:Uncharacterized protein n=1 Tax=Caerostris darwini TaxID=1538125 RepID=A0AAV4UL61_9ARAC|nr:hypothetical protein CDAR_294831 [Caerostris darwini]